jgi:uncharacterized OB-fold protein
MAQGGDSAVAVRLENGAYRAPLELTYPYSRTAGTVVTRFLQGLAARRIEGNRTSDGRVHVPPVEFDPVSGERCDEWVAVAPTGAVVSWTWQPEPNEANPLGRPFAWALIRLDGADTPMLHAVAVDTPDEIASGARVEVVWADEPRGAITDISHFVVGEPAEPAGGSASKEPRDASTGEPVAVREPISVVYDYSAGPGFTSFLDAIDDGRLVGRRCPSCEQVYFPPRNGVCPRCGVLLADDVEVGPQGTVTTYCVVNVPFLGQQIEIPYVAASIRLDGADIAFQHLIQEVEASDVHTGMRVEPVWKQRSEWERSLTNIAHFRPVGDGSGR